ncbi:Uncharacterised protein [Streptococcus pneumoniae]|nr:Uncharacterised protein [Streptococcus pneumoniae]
MTDPLIDVSAMPITLESCLNVSCAEEVFEWMSIEAIK